MDEAFEKRLRDWLENSGRNLELRTARAFNQAGAHVQPSISYRDTETQQLRETDVLAAFGWTGLEQVPCTITAVVECKSSTKHPWVGFYSWRNRYARDLDAFFTFAHGPFTGITEPLFDLWAGKPPFDDLSVATHVVAAFTGGNEQDAVYAATRQALSAAAAVRADYIASQATRRVGICILPVIVVEAPLIKCQLQDDGTIRLEECDSMQVWTNDDLAGKQHRAYILRESALPAFADGLASLARLAHHS